MDAKHLKAVKAYLDEAKPQDPSWSDAAAIEWGDSGIVEATCLMTMLSLAQDPKAANGFRLALDEFE